ncbi:hypothetical protein [Reinekea marinisedimentorum]|uniref:Zn-dependent protease n=1 Tax=Reinekea marinisedimentorum TaxID=230495 RepID=A0A4R3I1Z0_9GAMM|nr:hypothetical protein [Reinekea marinisedimentorum]TCS39786.1 Zn-dependent protease [Reinekea marinisedimentorum]
MTVLIILLTLATVFIGLNIFKILSIRLLDSPITEISPTDVPEPQVEKIIQAEKQLHKLGFKRLKNVTRQKTVQDQEWGLYGVIYYNSSTKTYAFAFIEPFGHPALDHQLYLINYFGSKKYITLSGSITFNKEPNPELIIHDSMTVTFEEQWNSHKKLISEVNEKTGNELQMTDLLILLEKIFFSGMKDSGALKKQGDYYKFTLKSAFTIVKYSNTKNQKLIKLKKKRQSQEIGNKNSSLSAIDLYEEYKAHHKLKETQKASQSLKAILLVASTILFAASFKFGFGLSIQSLIILVVVIFVHEAGHLIGMMLFRYRDLNMLFVPFLGALASGKKEKISSWQEAIILVLGPLPGYILGLYLLLQYSGPTPQWVFEYALISVILNGINLLPFMPLDGGKILNLALFNKLPKLQLSFYILSLISFTIIGWWGETVAYILAAILFISLPFFVKETQLMSYLLSQKAHLNYASPLSIIEAISTRPAWIGTTGAARWQILDSLNHRIQHAQSNPVTMLAILCLWGASIAAPVYLTTDTNQRLLATQFLSIFMGSSYEMVAIEDLEKRYIEATTDLQKIEALAELLTRLHYENIEKGNYYWGRYKELVQSNSLDVGTKISHINNMSSLCELYNETKNCSIAYKREILNLNASPQDFPQEFIDIYHFLAEYDDLQKGEALTMLNRAGALIDNLPEPYLIPIFHSEQLYIYNKLNEFDLAFQAGNQAIVQSSLLSPEMTATYVIELANSLVYWGKKGQAESLVANWQGKVETDSNTEQPLEGNLFYIHAWLLSDHDPEASIDLLNTIKTEGIANQLKLETTKYFLYGKEDQESAEYINSLARSIDSNEAYLINSFTYIIQNATSHPTDLYDQHGISFTFNTWYAKLRKTINQREFKDLKEALYAQSYLDEL